MPKQPQTRYTAREVVRQMTPDHPTRNGQGLDLQSSDTLKLMDQYVQNSGGGFTFEELEAEVRLVLGECALGFACLS